MIATNTKFRPPPLPKPAVDETSSRGESERHPTDSRSNRRQSRIVTKPPLVPLTARWLTKWINVGRPGLLVRTKRLLAWTAYSGYQLYTMSRALLGGRITSEQFDARMAVCEDCPSLQKRLVRIRPHVKLFCGSCGCPQWWLSELGPVGARSDHRQTRRYKNYLRKWECPLNRHERISDPPEWKAIIEAEARWVGSPAVLPVPSQPVDAMGLPAVRSGCGGGRHNGHS